MKSCSIAVIFAVSGMLLSSTAIAFPLNINVKNSSKAAVFIFWDETGRCAKSAKCKPFKGMQEPKDGLLIQPGAVWSFGADDKSVQVGDAPTAHVFSAIRGKLPRTETSTKAFSPADLSQDITKSGVVTLNWTGNDFKKE